MENIELLAPNCGMLMRHIDEILLYADEEHIVADELLPRARAEHATRDDDALLFSRATTREGKRRLKKKTPRSYLEYFVSRLDALGPHLPLLRPHLFSKAQCELAHFRRFRAYSLGGGKKEKSLTRLARAFAGGS